MKNESFSAAQEYIDIPLDHQYARTSADETAENAAKDSWGKPALKLVKPSQAGERPASPGPVEIPVDHQIPAKF